MTPQKIGEVCNRLTDRLSDPALDRYQLLNLAAVLVLVQSDLDRAFSQLEEGVPERVSLDELTMSLRWVRAHRAGTSAQELRDHVSTACGASVASVHLLQDPGSPSLTDRISA